MAQSGLKLEPAGILASYNRMVSSTSESMQAVPIPAKSSPKPVLGKPALYKEFQVYRCGDGTLWDVFTSS